MYLPVLKDKPAYQRSWQVSSFRLAVTTFIFHILANCAAAVQNTGSMAEDEAGKYLLMAYGPSNL
jgi:hypothetical protein